MGLKISTDNTQNPPRTLLITRPTKNVLIQLFFGRRPCQLPRTHSLTRSNYYGRGADEEWKELKLFFGPKLLKLSKKWSGHAPRPRALAGSNFCSRGREHESESYSWIGPRVVWPLPKGGRARKGYVRTMAPHTHMGNGFVRVHMVWQGS